MRATTLALAGLLAGCAGLGVDPQTLTAFNGWDSTADVQVALTEVTTGKLTWEHRFVGIAPNSSASVTSALDSSVPYMVNVTATSPTRVASFEQRIGHVPDEAEVELVLLEDGAIEVRTVVV